MTKRFGFLMLSALMASAALGACGDDDDSPDPGMGGEGGEPAGTAGSKSGGAGMAGKAGSSAGGAGADAGGAGGAGGAGTTDGGEPPLGGAPQGGQPSDGGAAGEDAGGAGGSGEPALVYACNDLTLDHKLCSALAAAECEIATDCATCVGDRRTEREDFATPCATCNALYDDYFQCAVDAFESGEVLEGVECVEEFGGDLHFEKCVVPRLDLAVQCQNYIQTNDCPASWPPG